MKTKIGIVITLIEIVSLLLLFSLLKQSGLPDKIGVSLIMLLPITFGCHVIEEFIFPGGFIEWNKSYRPHFAGAMTTSFLFRVNAIPLGVSVLTTLGAFNYMGGYSRGGICSWLAFMSILAFNAIYHIWGAFRTKQYSPGMATGILLYIPLTIYSFIYFLRMGAVDIFSAIGCLAIGLVFQSVLDYIKEHMLKKKRDSK
jgi:hypothetical protein